MKIAFKNQAKQKTNSSMYSVIEYPLNDHMLNIAIATIAGLMCVIFHEIPH